MNQSSQLATLFLSSLAALSLSLPACIGETPDPESTPDAGTAPNTDAAPGDPDAGEDTPPITRYKVSGTVMDYFDANIGNATPIANAAIATDGLAPPLTMNADALGAFSMDVLPASLFYVTVNASGFAPSRNASVQVLDEDLLHNLIGASTSGIARQYIGAGGLEPIAIVPGNGMIMIELQRNNGQPAIDIPLANIVLSTLAEPEIPVSTAYLVDPITTDLSPNDITLVSAVDGQNTARAGFLNILPGEYNLSVTI